MIYTSAIFVNADESMVTGTDENGATETRSIDNPHEFRREKEFITGFLANGGTIAPYVAPAPPVPTEIQITKRQLVAALILGGGITDPDAFVEAAIATIADPTIKALAINDWRNAPYYVRSHPLFTDGSIMGAAGLDAAAVDGLWALAVGLPR